ncbi:MAG: S-layer homology domain-containing protein [Caryophanon sp.]|nr:S-layer homology domain-containing protein [Caryophanon sp.]
MKDAIVRVSGTVTRTTSDSFVIQDVGDGDAATSDAIFVAAKGHSYKAGDVVTVEGQVVEQGADLTTTTIVAESHEKTSEAALPTALYIGQDVVAPKSIIDNDGLTSFDPAEDAIDFYESLEGMRVAVKDAKIVAPQSGGTTVVVPNIEGLTFNNLGGLSIAKDNFNPSRIFVDKGNNTATSGDSFKGDIVGVMGYDSSNFKLFTTEALPELVTNAHKDDVTHIEVDENKLTVATYNIENFSAATPVDKTKGLAKQIVNNLKTPDVIALTEVQDNDGATDSGDTDASKSYEALITEIKALTNVEYKWTDIAPEDKQDGGAPGGNIRPGFLYNPERVTLQEAPKGSATEGTAWTADGELTLNPGRVMEHKQENTRKALAAQFTFNKTGEAFTVIGAHLNSKSGDESLFGKTQPATLKSEAERVELAAAIQSFVKKGLAQNPNANIFVAGDMNDFEFSAPVQALKGDTLTNMIDEVEAADRFTYSFEGNNQVLDHILVTHNLVETANVDVVHVNANVQEKNGSFSDHDPVLVQVELVKVEEPVEETPEVTPIPSPAPTPNPAPPTTTPEVEQPVEETPEEPVEETPEVPEEETPDVEEQPEEESPSVEAPEETPEEQPAVVVPFTDVANSYSKEAIDALYAAGITTGTTETTFSPTAPMTRAQFAVMIARALDVKATKATPFTDVQGKWYADAVGALYEAGIVTGKTETTFEPGATITRQQAAALIVRLMEKQNYTFTNTAALSYNDAANISPYAQDAAAKLLAENIMTGDNNNFMPQQPLTRQQMAKILYTALVKVNVLN